VLEVSGEVNRLRAWQVDLHRQNLVSECWFCLAGTGHPGMPAAPIPTLPGNESKWERVAVPAKEE
jgi:hypothetical protein